MAMPPSFGKKTTKANPFAKGGALGKTDKAAPAKGKPAKGANPFANLKKKGK